MKTENRQQLELYLKFILPTLEDSEEEKGYIWVNNEANNFNKQLYFNSYQEGIAIIEKYRHNSCCVGLATTNGKGNSKENLINRSTIFIDIDKENLEVTDIYNLCKKVQLFGHLIVSSGRGWHIYLKLDDNYSIDKITEVNKYITELFGADAGACITTQIARIPFTKNLKVNVYSSMVKTSVEIKPYSLSYLKGHKPKTFKTSDTEIEFNNIEDLYCFNQIVKHGASKGFRNQCVMFIASCCKYADITEGEALQYAYEFNSNCIEQQSTTKIKKDVKSIYKNTSIIKPCTQEIGKRLCNTLCKCKVITTDDVLNLSNLNIDNKVVGFTKKHIIAKAKDNKGDKKHMLEILNGTELLIMATLKVCNNRLFTQEDLINFIEVSKPTVLKALKSLEEKNIILITKQSINKGERATKLYSYNFGFEKYNEEIMHLNTNLFTARLQKSIKDNDLKVAIAIRYLMATNTTVTYEDIGHLSGIDSTNINKHIKALEKAKLIIVDKLKTSSGKCNSYQLLY